MTWTNVACAGLAVLAIGCSDEGAGTDSGVSTDLATTVSLYDKYGGAATVQSIVDQAVVVLTSDCEEAGYFSVLGQAGHDSVDRLKGCLVLQFTAALGGPATYPGTNAAGDACEDMTTIHAGLGIPGPVFDVFVTDVVGVLTQAGVTPDDLAKIAPVLTGLKTQIVSSTPVDKTTCGDGGAHD